MGIISLYIKVKGKPYIYCYYVRGKKFYAVRKRVQGVKKPFFHGGIESLEEAERVVGELLLGSVQRRAKLYQVIDSFHKYLIDGSRGALTTNHSKILKLESFKNFFSDIWYDKLTYQSFRFYRDNLARLNVLPATKNKYISLFQEMDDFAVKKMKLRSCLADCFEPFPMPPRDMRKSAEKDAFLNIGEVNRLFAVCDDYDRLFFRWTFYLALRSGEARSFKPCNILFEEGLARVKDNLQDRVGLGKSIEVGETKGKKIVYVPVPVFLLEEVKTHIEKNRIQPDEYIFFSPRDKHVAIGKNTVARRLANALERAGLGSRGATMHSLRKAFATYLAQSGMTDDEVARFIGHSSVSTTREYYIQLSKPTIQKALQIAEKANTVY